MRRPSSDVNSEVAGVAPDGDDTFERRYLKYVAISEGCGCAERLIRDGRAPLHGNALREIFRALAHRLGRR